MTNDVIVFNGQVLPELVGLIMSVPKGKLDDKGYQVVLKVSVDGSNAKIIGYDLINKDGNKVDWDSALT